MPLVQSCSFAIAAACHRPTDDVDAFKNEIQWGEVANRYGEGEDKVAENVGHCSFSADTVVEPQSGRLYA